MFMAKFTTNHFLPDTFANFARRATREWNQYFNPSEGLAYNSKLIFQELFQKHKTSPQQDHIYRNMQCSGSGSLREHTDLIFRQKTIP